jgi:hypothetical protein
VNSGRELARGAMDPNAVISTPPTMPTGTIAVPAPSTTGGPPPAICMRGVPSLLCAPLANADSASSQGNFFPPALSAPALAPGRHSGRDGEGDSEIGGEDTGETQWARR